MKHAAPATFVALLAFCGTVKGRSFSIPEKSATPGSLISFPVSLDSAAGCASIQIQLNYDSQFLDYIGFETGAGLGSQFSPTSFVENGVVTLIWTRSSGLASGSGILGMVKFRVNEGAPLGAVTPLTISNFETCDETGVIEYALSESITADSGSLTISSSAPDSDNDGIPDAWEEFHSLNPGASNFSLDSDFDGRSDFLEFAFGGNPNGSDSQRSPKVGSSVFSTSNYLSLSFYRQKNSNLVYRVLESTDLTSWSEVMISTRLIGDPIDLGDGTEKLTVRSTFQINGSETSQSGFMKVEVEKP